MKLKFITLLASFLFFCPFLGQQNIESLQKELKKSREDTAKVNLLFKIALNYTNQGAFDKTIEYAEKTLSLSQKLKYTKGETQALSIMGDAYSSIGDFDNAEKNQRKALAIFTKQKNKDGVALTYNHLAIIRSYQSKYPEALEYFRKSLSLYEELEDPVRIADMYNNIATTYVDEGNFTDALKNTLIGLRISEKIKNEDGISTSYNNLGMIYSNQKKYDKALYSFKKCMEYEKATGNDVGALGSKINIALIYHYQKKYDIAVKEFLEALKTAEKMQYIDAVATIYGNLGDSYTEQHKTGLALESFKKASEISSEMGDLRALAGWQSNIGRIYNINKQPREALAELEKALEISKKIGTKEITRDIYLDMSKSDSMLGNYSRAFENYKLFTKHKDSLFNEENTTKLVTLQKDYEFSKKEDVLKATIEAKRKEKWFYIAGILALLVIAGLLIYQGTQRKKLDFQKLEAKRKEAEALIELDNTKSKFLTNITHEFRTPLTLIKGNVELMRKEIHNSEHEVHLSEIETNSEKLLSLINKLLELSKIESGKYQLIYNNGDIASEVRNLVAMFDSAVYQKNIDLNLNINENITEKLNKENHTFSSEALETIINNLLSNAIKFTPEAGKISVDLSLHDKKENTILIKVKDNGIGIPAEQIGYVFDVFHQVDDSAHRKFIGSGVGLSLVKELSVLHGGDAVVESKENEGSTFEVSLFLGNKESEILQTKPAKQYRDAEYDIREISNDILEDLQERNSEKALVLVVEDNPDIAGFIKKCLTDNFRLIEAGDGTEGFEMAKKHVPDLIISDIMMPNTDGIKLSTLIKEHDITRHIPIILLTAKSGHDHKIEGLKTGADDYLTKPFSIQELILRVNNLIRLRKVLRQKFSTALVIKPEEMDLDSKDKIFIDQLITAIENHLSDSAFGVEQLADKIHLSASQLNRKLRAITGQSTLKFIQNIRLQKAFEMLQAESDNISGIAYETGFESASYFSKVFKKHFGFLPSEVEKSA